MTYWPPADLGEVLALVQTGLMVAGFALGATAYHRWSVRLQAQRQRQAVNLFFGNAPVLDEDDVDEGR